MSRRAAGRIFTCGSSSDTIWSNEVMYSPSGGPGIKGLCVTERPWAGRVYGPILPTAARLKDFCESSADRRPSACARCARCAARASQTHPPRCTPGLSASASDAIRKTPLSLTITARHAHTVVPPTGTGKNDATSRSHETHLCRDPPMRIRTSAPCLGHPSPATGTARRWTGSRSWRAWRGWLRSRRRSRCTARTQPRPRSS